MKEIKENLFLSSLLDYTCMYATQNTVKSFAALCSAAGDPKLWFNTGRVLCGRISSVDTDPLASAPQLPESAPSLYHFLTAW